MGGLLTTRERPLEGGGGKEEEARTCERGAGRQGVGVILDFGLVGLKFGNPRDICHCCSAAGSKTWMVEALKESSCFGASGYRFSNTTTDTELLYRSCSATATISTTAASAAATTAGAVLLRVQSQTRCQVHDVQLPLYSPCLGPDPISNVTIFHVSPH